MPNTFSQGHEDTTGATAHAAIGSQPNPQHGRPVGMRILLADDHGMVRETISAYLTTEGRAAVVSASDYFEAMKALELKGGPLGFGSVAEYGIARGFAAEQ